MNLYLHAAGMISAAGSNIDDHFPAPPLQDPVCKLLCKEPDYTGIIPPMQLRRMSKAVRMGIAASKICLQKAGIEKPDAISVGTALGCLNDSEVFLTKMISQKEQMLTPTAFIQSTHNTVAGQIALVTGCNGHNLTFVHKGHSFEHAILNSMLYLQDHPGEKVLAGGIEELNETSFAIHQTAGVYIKTPRNPEIIFHQSTKGSIAGEGAGFFLVSDQAVGRNGIILKALKPFVARDAAEALQEVISFTEEQGFTRNPDLVLLGINGDQESQSFYEQLREKIFPSASHAAFKHLTGDFPVSSALALGLLQEFSTKEIPSSMILNRAPEKLRDLILINHYQDHYSCWILFCENS